MLPRHPQASRELWLGDALVAYAFTRARRRSIGFSVGPDGLAVRAPSWVALREVEDALRQRADWIIQKLQQARQRQAEQAACAIDWRDGGQLPYLGQPLTLRLLPGAPAGSVRAAASALAQLAPDGQGRILQLGLSEAADPAHIRDATRLWLMRQARPLFAQRLDQYAPLLGVRWSRLALSNARTRWGSASADGAIRLNWRLLHFSLPVLDYVVVHELSHLRVMNHSPRFWEVVGSILPDYAALRRQLRQTHTPRWD